MIRIISQAPETLADDIVAMIEATARLGLSPHGHATALAVEDVLMRVQGRLLERLSGREEGSAERDGLRERLGARVSER